MSEPDASSTSTPPAALKRTPFHEFHLSAGARMVEFAGWEMPLVYTSIVEEHHQCRNSGAFFDVSHMGRLRFAGKDVEKYLNNLVTRDISKMKPGQSRYAFVCNERGGIMDDVIVARHEGSDEWSVVCNGANRAKIVAHFERVRQVGSHDVVMDDVTEETAMCALQGPKVIEDVANILNEAVDEDVRTLKKWNFARGLFMDSRVEVYRSGYTGEDGVELIMSGPMAKLLVGMIGHKWRQAQSLIKPAGLGARDTLRIEAGLPLYGHELDEDIDPLATGFGWAVSTNTAFIGADAIEKLAAEGGPKKKLVGLDLDGRRTARQGTPIVLNDLQVGAATSGTFSPTLSKSIAMAYVATEFAGVGTRLGVDFKKEVMQATVVPLPFYKRD
jgi:aminomethyltransferase